MTFFLTPHRKDKGAAHSSQASDRREAFANELAAYRKATGKPESRSIPCRCAVTARAFVIVFERVSPAHRFQIARIDAGPADGGESRLHRLLFERAPQLRCYEAAEFDWAGCVCPHCRTSGLINCDHCRETVCSGRTRPLPNGGRAFACQDACGATGETEPATHVQGAVMSRPALPRPETQKALPGNRRLRLTGPKR